MVSYFDTPRNIMDRSQSPDQRAYTTTGPLYPPVRRSERNHYTTSMSQQPEYHSAPSAMSPRYDLNLSYTHSSPSHSSGSGYLDMFPGMPMQDAMGIGMSSTPVLDLNVLSTQDYQDFRLSGSQVRGSIHRDSQKQRRAQSDDGSVGSAPDGAGRGKKQRGRPRLDPKDESAADRRRTQIRLAQRAYRLRKETTISSLRSRVVELETAIENMQSTFLDFHSFAWERMQKTEDGDREINCDTMEFLTGQFLSLAKGALNAEHPESLGEDETSEGTGHSRRSPSSDCTGHDCERQNFSDLQTTTWDGFFPRLHSAIAGDEGRSGLVAEGEKKDVNIDIFARGLAERGMCLGQYPGSKRNEVVASRDHEMVY